MIVLRIDVSGHSADVRWAGAEVVLGSGSGAAIQRDDAGWGPREAVLVHLGSEVLVVRGDGGGERRLKIGDSMTIGEAQLTLVGLLPLVADLDSESADAPAFFESPAAAAKTSSSEWTPTLAEDAVPAARSESTAPPPLPTSAAEHAPAAAAPAHVTASLERAPPPSVTLASSVVAAQSSSPASAAPPAPPAPSSPVEKVGAAKAADARWRQGSFEDELYAALKRTPWFALSASIHAVLFALLLLLAPPKAVRIEEPERYGIVTAQTEIPEHPEDSGGPTDRAEPERPPEEYTAPDVDDPAPPEPTIDAPKEKPKSGADAVDPLPTPPEGPQPDVGLSRSSIALRTSSKVKPPKAAPPGDDWVNHDPDRAVEVNQKAAAKVREDMKRGGGALGAALKGLKREDILVIRGNFDHMEAVLEELKIPYTLVSPYEIFQDYDFHRHKIVFWNCMDPEVSMPPRHRARIITAVREFVRDGGFLFTTDWAISFLIVPAFPGYLKTNGGLNPLPEMILPVLPTRVERENALLEGVFSEGARVLWWLETASQDVEIVRGANVDVLIESRALDTAPKPRSPIIAATFTFGKGRVLHTMGHYYQQKGNIAGAAGAQRLALNFVRMRLEKPASAPR